MGQIIVTRKFRHCVEGAHQPTTFAPSPDPIDVDAETEQIAVREGWAKPFRGGTEQPGLRSRAAGQAQQSRSPQEGRHSRKGKSTRRGADAS